MIRVTPKGAQAAKAFYESVMRLSPGSCLGNRRCLMMGVGCRFMVIASKLLQPLEREAVLGDLLEAGESGWRGLFAVLGLWMRRQADLWTNWRPWLAAFGLALPASFLLMGFSLSVSHAYRQWIGIGLFQLTGLNVDSGFSLRCTAASIRRI